MIRFGPEICRNLKAAMQREWLETNGLGGFASSTLIGLNTRRYHGLLTAALTSPVGRYVLLSKLEETLIVHGERFELSANQYAGALHPRGYHYLTRFRLDPFPVFTYTVADVEVEKSICMIHGENSTIVHYAIRPPRWPAASDYYALEVRALIAFREAHSTTHHNNALNPAMHIAPGLVTVAPYAGLPALHCAHDADEVVTTGHWYYNFEYAVERERGFDYVEDLFSPFALRFDLSQRTEAAILASTEPHDITQVTSYRQAEVERRQALLTTAPGDDAFVRTLVAAADHYVVGRGAKKTVVAGYHWLSDEGRDTMIALPGLALVTGRTGVAKSLLLTFAGVVDQGMLPNRFPALRETPEYTTVDASLWFFEAIRALWYATREDAFIRTYFYDTLTDIIDWHVRGTRYGIKVDEDGLLAASEPGMPLTWMNARVGDWVVTPRYGKPVEIQALWYNALRIMEHLAQTFGDTANQQRYGTMAAQAHASFNRVFWHEAANCLYDVVNGAERDGTMRPNQIFAASLPYTMLSDVRAQSVVAAVERDLLTPYGLRSLAPYDPQYRGRCTGDAASRDRSYHQGSVWAWLMGPFITAYLKVQGATSQARQQAAQWLSGFRRHLSDAGLGHVSEIFDGDPPHQPRGCIAQARSVAELLRAAAALDLLGTSTVE
jgi:predicted glycogen debranching enzyme